MIAFGPIPSRRLGNSLGINNIPPKTCSYDCIYCQAGRTIRKVADRHIFYEPEEVFQSVSLILEALREDGVEIDYLTFVPDGEPTLDINLGTILRKLKPLGVKTAVVSNGCQLWREDVRQDLMEADCVSIKMDSVLKDQWKEVNRPQRELTLEKILEGIVLFAREYQGRLITETMMIRDFNDDARSLKAIAQYLKTIGPEMAYLSVPTRPPQEAWAEAPDEEIMNHAFQIFSDYVPNVEIMVGNCDEVLKLPDNVVGKILDITSVHPLRERDIFTMFYDADESFHELDHLMDEHELLRVMHEGQPFYIRRFTNHKDSPVSIG